MMGLMSMQDADPFTDDEGDLRRGATPKVLPTKGPPSDSEEEAPRRQQKAELFEPTEEAAEDYGLPEESSGKFEGSCPVLWCGSQQNKSVMLPHAKWITLGKDACSVRLPSRGVSGKHCQLRWLGDKRLVEFMDSSTNGTWVSGEKVQRNEEPMKLQHGARVVVQAGGTRYIFVLDLRPAGMGLTDPREFQQGEAKERQERKLKKLKEQLTKLQHYRRNQENDIVEKEKLFYELHVQKEEMDVKTQMWRDEIERIKAATEEVRSKVSETRKGWKKRLVEIHQGNEVAAKPLTERTIEKQEQVGKLELEVNELERQIYPDRFALAELPEEVKPAPGSELELTDNEQDSARPQVQPSATPEEDSAALVSAAQKPQSSGYAPTTPAKTPAPDLDSAPLMESAPLMDSAQFAEEAGAFIQNLSMKDLFGEEDDAEDGEAGSAPSAPSAGASGAKRPRLEGS